MATPKTKANAVLAARAPSGVKKRSGDGDGAAQRATDLVPVSGASPVSDDDVPEADAAAAKSDTHASEAKPRVSAERRPSKSGGVDGSGRKAASASANTVEGRVGAGGDAAGTGAPGSNSEGDSAGGAIPVTPAPSGVSGTAVTASAGTSGSPSGAASSNSASRKRARGDDASVAQSTPADKGRPSASTNGTTNGTGDRAAPAKPAAGGGDKEAAEQATGAQTSADSGSGGATTTVHGRAAWASGVALDGCARTRGFPPYRRPAKRARRARSRDGKRGYPKGPLRKGASAASWGGSSVGSASTSGPAAMDGPQGRPRGAAGHCSKCGEAGHNRRTCERRKLDEERRLARMAAMQDAATPRRDFMGMGGAMGGFPGMSGRFDMEAMLQQRMEAFRAGAMGGMGDMAAMQMMHRGMMPPYGNMGAGGFRWHPTEGGADGAAGAQAFGMPYGAGGDGFHPYVASAMYGGQGAHMYPGFHGAAQAQSGFPGNPAAQGGNGDSLGQASAQTGASGDKKVAPQDQAAAESQGSRARAPPRTNGGKPGGTPGTSGAARGSGGGAGGRAGWQGQVPPGAAYPTPYGFAGPGSFAGYGQGVDERGGVPAPYGAAAAAAAYGGGAYSGAPQPYGYGDPSAAYAAGFYQGGPGMPGGGKAAAYGHGSSAQDYPTPYYPHGVQDAFAMRSMMGMGGGGGDVGAYPGFAGGAGAGARPGARAAAEGDAQGGEQGGQGRGSARPEFLL